GWSEPAGQADPDWLGLGAPSRGGGAIPPDPDLGGTRLPPAGEASARERLRDFLRDGLADYADRRDFPAADATSRLSPYLKWGCVHPRTVLGETQRAAGRSGGALPAAAEKFRSEVAWREFYADVLAANPSSARRDLSGALAAMPYEQPGDAFEAWKWGRTGYPVVDAGMRQLLAEGWVHNRIRMIEASFVCKDLHVHWSHGARWYLERLVDGDLASNNHG
ncbi:FAD-binding domain-containing protein, partial [Frankia sp. EI5c]|uniref:FAD-binding domain-containing protein n=1 Tax=Frankia sp. EI5c TaxID=683316 RepID=UPI0026F46F75